MRKADTFFGLLLIIAGVALISIVQFGGKREEKVKVDEQEAVSEVVEADDSREQEKLEKEKLEQEKLEQERLEKERIEQEQLEQEEEKKLAESESEYSMKVVVLEDGVVARYVSENGDSYVCELQDSFTVPKNGAKLAVWKAKDGLGVVYMKKPGSCPVYSLPKKEGKPHFQLSYEAGMVPNTYRCIGYTNGWFKVTRGEQFGYVEAGYVEWDAVNSF